MTRNQDTHDCSTHGRGGVVRTVEKAFFSILLGGFVLMASGFAAQLASAGPADDGAVACAPSAPCAPRG